MFPKRINVQFMKIIDRRNIKIEIWERGAGYTLASGSSSKALPLPSSINLDCMIRKLLSICSVAISTFRSITNFLQQLPAWSPKYVKGLWQMKCLSSPPNHALHPTPAGAPQVFMNFNGQRRLTVMFGGKL